MVGAFIGATVLAVALGILFAKIGGALSRARRPWAARPAGSIGGAAAGFGLSLWLALRRDGRNAGTTLAWIAMAGLAVAALLVLAMLSS